MDITNSENKNIVQMNGKQHSIIKETEVIQFIADVEFGMPSKKCANFGICRINPVNQVNPSRKNCCEAKTFSAEINYYHSSRLEMSFEINEIGTTCKEKYFSTKYFKVEEGFQTTLQLEKYSSTKSIIIKKGNYEIIKTDKHYCIIFS